MSGPLDFDTALPAQGLNAPHKFATSHTPSVGQKCPEGNRKRGQIEDAEQAVARRGCELRRHDAGRQTSEDL